MDGNTRNLFVLSLVMVIAVTGGAALILGGGTGGEPGSPPGTTVVDGVIVGVKAESLGDVRSFTLRTSSGEVLEFGLASLENGDEFPPGHLAEHQVTAEMVRVWYRDDGGTMLAIRVEDAAR